ncbi:phage tail protein [Actinoplanes sp. NPDC051861]|uniref:phage tail protein n=1 Tax=Actinoplanes sp. NPDC051861 TaxID=3155170 RepID=UPI00342BB48E
MATGERNDPYAGFNFLVEVDGVIAAGFNSVKGLDQENAAIEYRNGDETQTVRKLPGLRTYPNIVLTRGYTDNKLLWQWRKRVVDGRTQRQSGSIVLLNEAREEALRWNFRDGWPAKLQGPSLDAKQNEVAIETLEIAHEGLEMA